MNLKDDLSKILIVDFGSQFTQLIARRIREFGVYSEIISHKKINSRMKRDKIKGIILSGGPLNVYQSQKFKFNREIFNWNIPILGICFGHQLITKELGGKVRQAKYREFGLAKLKRLNKSKLTNTITE